MEPNAPHDGNCHGCHDAILEAARLLDCKMKPHVTCNHLRIFNVDTGKRWVVGVTDIAVHLTPCGKCILVRELSTS